MEEQKDLFDLLEMMVQPVFCVKEGHILSLNSAARKLFLNEGEPVEPLLKTGAEEYRSMTEGCLYLTLVIGGQSFPASVRRMKDLDIFEIDTEDAGLQSLTLASSQLRKPLGAALSQASQLLDNEENPEVRAQLAQLNRNLYRMLRMLGNMSDADPTASHTPMETVNAGAFLGELFEKAQTLAQRSGRQLRYQGLQETVFCLLNRDQLERAVLNILSNAMKYTPKDGTIDATLTRRGRMLVLTVQDSGSGISQEIMGSLFRRHLRKPGIEDGRNGLGLGIRLIHAAAIHHGGTLLVTQGEAAGTKVVMTMAIRQKQDYSFRSPVFTMDYTGGFDHSLVELSEILDAGLYDGSY